MGEKTIRKEKKKPKKDKKVSAPLISIVQPEKKQ